MTAGHGLCFVLPVRRGKGLTFQFVATQSALACSCLVGDYSLHFCAWSQLASCF